MEGSPVILALPADMHCGSPLGLLPESGWVLADGNQVLPNGTQTLLQKLWVTGWKRIREMRAGHRLIVVSMGDATEGLHHNSTQVLSARVEEHEAMHVAVMEQALKIAGFNYDAGDLLYYVAGTDAHTGPGSASEERIARAFAQKKLIPEMLGGRLIFEQLKLEINGKLFDLAHHGANLSRNPWGKTNPLRNRLAQVYWRCLEEQRRAPDVWVRAHRHVKAHDVYVSGRGGRVEGYVTPAFQSRTEYGHQVAADELASLGLLWFEIDQKGNAFPFWELLEYDPVEVIRV